MDSMIANLNNWLGVIGFVLTLATLAMTLNIRGKLSKTVDKQQFLKEREEILKRLVECYNAILTPSDQEPYQEILLLVQRNIEQLANYDIWAWSVKQKIHKFSDALSLYITAYVSGCSFSGKRYYIRTEVDLLQELNKIIAMVKKESTVL
jgi:hypothetical protein